MQDDLFGESDRRKADKAEILEDLKRFEEYIKLEKKYAHSKHIYPNTLNMVTKWLREKADKRRTLQSKSERFTPISNKTRCIYTIIRMRFRKILLLNLRPTREWICRNNICIMFLEILSNT